MNKIIVSAVVCVAFANTTMNGMGSNKKFWEIGRYLTLKKKLIFPHLTKDNKGNCWEMLAFDIQRKYLSVTPLIEYPENNEDVNVVTDKLLSLKDLSVLESTVEMIHYDEDGNRERTIATTEYPISTYVSWLSKVSKFFAFFEAAFGPSGYIPLEKGEFESKYEGEIIYDHLGSYRRVPVCDATDDNCIVFLMDLKKDKKRHAMMFDVNPGKSCKLIADLGVYEGATKCIIDKFGDTIAIGCADGNIALLRIKHGENGSWCINLKDGSKTLVEDFGDKRITTIFYEDGSVETTSEAIEKKKKDSPSFTEGYNPNNKRKYPDDKDSDKSKKSQKKTILE